MYRWQEDTAMTTMRRRHVDEPVQNGKASRPQEEVEYTMGRTATETGRLMQQAELVQSFTRHLLEDAGIGSGMKVLDLGTGAGDVAMLAARLVGPTGAVVGIDTNPAVLAVARDRCRARAGHVRRGRPPHGGSGRRL